MNTLSKRNYELISYGVNMHGTFNPEEIFYSFEEELSVSQLEEIWNFLAWCHANDKRFGFGNYKDRFAEYKASK